MHSLRRWRWRRRILLLLARTPRNLDHVLHRRSRVRPARVHLCLHNAGMVAGSPQTRSATDKARCCLCELLPASMTARPAGSSARMPTGSPRGSGGRSARRPARRTLGPFYHTWPRPPQGLLPVLEYARRLSVVSALGCRPLPPRCSRLRPHGRAPAPLPWIVRCRRRQLGLASGLSTTTSSPATLSKHLARVSL